eukprot:6738716-Prymnesium_polylepis.4
MSPKVVPRWVENPHRGNVVRRKNYQAVAGERCTMKLAAARKGGAYVDSREEARRRIEDANTVCVIGAEDDQPAGHLHRIVVLAVLRNSRADVDDRECGGDRVEESDAVCIEGNEHNFCGVRSDRTAVLVVPRYNVVDVNNDKFTAHCVEHAQPRSLARRKDDMPVGSWCARARKFFVDANLACNIFRGKDPRDRVQDADFICVRRGKDNQPVACCSGSLAHARGVPVTPVPRCKHNKPVGRSGGTGEEPPPRTKAGIQRRKPHPWWCSRKRRRGGNGGVGGGLGGWGGGGGAGGGSAGGDGGTRNTPTPFA